MFMDVPIRFTVEFSQGTLLFTVLTEDDHLQILTFVESTNGADVVPIVMNDETATFPTVFMEGTPIPRGVRTMLYKCSE